MILTIDIETVPTQLAWAHADLAEGVRPPATLKKAESIAEWEANSRAAAVQEVIDRTSFDGGLGQVVVIGWAIDDKPAESVQVDDLSAESEQDMLGRFVAAMRTAYAGTSGSRPTIVGHNVIAFDLPFLWKRAIVHQVRMPLWIPRDAKPWGDSVFDTMTKWAGLKDRVSLDRLCKILGVEGKGDGPTGADVWPMVQRGEIDAVAAYCRADVDRTRACYLRMTFGGGE